MVSSNKFNEANDLGEYEVVAEKKTSQSSHNPINIVFFDCRLVLKYFNIIF